MDLSEVLDFAAFAFVFMVSLFLAIVALAIVVAFAESMLTSEASKENWRGAPIARVCSGGTTVYRLNDGTYAIWTGRQVLDVATVCQSGSK